MDPTTPSADAPRRPPPPRSVADRARDWVTWFGAARLVAGIVSVAALEAVAFWLVRAPAPPVETTLPMATPSPTSVPVAATSSSTLPTPPAGPIVVHVAGAVNEPGVRTLPVGARVVDAVAAAGGLAPEAVADALNLAAELHDGDRVYVPRADDVGAIAAGVTPTTAPPGSDSGSDPAGSADAGPVPLNSAGAAELEELPGVGPSIAAAIVAYRAEHGPFLSVDGLTDVPGIGPAKLEALRGLVTV
jgi:competence protein ComEA